MPELKMQSSEFQELRDQAAAIGLQDVQLGRVLDLIILHLGHAHGLDPAEEDAKVEAARLEEERTAEDEQVQAEAEARTERRAIEDEQTLTPDQQTARATLRQQEDEQVKADEEARQVRREGEDARIAALTEEEEPAPVAAPLPTEEAAPLPEQTGAATVQEGN
jgi:hypothetical protein